MIITVPKKTISTPEFAQLVVPNTTEINYQKLSEDATTMTIRTLN